MTSDQHSSPIKTPKQLVVVVVLAFLVPVTLILLVSQLVMSSTKSSRDAKTDESRVLERIQPVGTVLLADASAPAGNLTGVQVFDQVCKTCHGAGIAGAPKVGDKGAWAPRIAQGDKVLFQHAIAGFQGKSGLMPPKGGNGDLADVEVERAVVYMANQSGGSLKEPPAPASTATAQGSSVPAGSVGVATASPGASPATAREASSGAPGAPTPPVPSSGGAMVAAAATPPAAAPAATAAAPAAGAKPDGKKVFETTCSVCHGAGIAGAPKFGDKAAWAPRIAQGTNVLYQHALQGFQGKSGVMPPRGGNTALGDADVKAAVDYMAAAAK
ncbi:MAG TPA: c-type cytochrome [Casimicrobiaceae bacterium]|nr:c-type cytochrome [Casimicrobiaceae bacterium]